MDLFDLEAMLGSEEVIPLSYVVTLEGRVHETVRALAAIQDTARSRGTAVFGASNWVEVHNWLQLGPQLGHVGGSGVARQLKQLGLSVAQLVREVLIAAGKPKPTYFIRTEVEGKVHSLQDAHGLTHMAPTKHSVNDALSYLSKRHEVVRTKHGTYEITDQMKGRSTET